MSFFSSADSREKVSGNFGVGEVSEENQPWGYLQVSS